MAASESAVVEPAQLDTRQRSVSGRRNVVKLLAAGAVGAVGGATLKSQRVGAADGEPILQGLANNATSRTDLRATNDTALLLYSDTYEGLATDGAAGNAHFVAGGGSPVGTGSLAGVLWVDGDGNWWAATHSDAQNAQWRKLAGPATSGALHLLDSPRRVYDSRPSEPPAIGPKTPLTPNVARAIDPKVDSSGVPEAARGVLITLTVPALAAAGFATVWPSGPWPGTSNINFGAFQNIATTTVVGLAPGATFLVQSNVETDFIIDIAGYYL
jgi:hypothetical protein